MARDFISSDGTCFSCRDSHLAFTASVVSIGLFAYAILASISWKYGAVRTSPERLIALVEAVEILSQELRRARETLQEFIEAQCFGGDPGGKHLASRAESAVQLATKELSSLTNASRHVTLVEGFFAQWIHRFTYVALQKDLEDMVSSENKRVIQVRLVVDTIDRFNHKKALEKQLAQQQSLSQRLEAIESNQTVLKQMLVSAVPSLDKYKE